MGLGIFTKEVNDESNDRLNHFFTFLLLLCCVVITCKRQYLGDPISCWVPKEFTRAHREYAESICWAMNTYHLGHERPIPKKLDERKAEELPYYQWVSFLLLGQAMMFQLPSLIWSGCLERRGLHLERALRLAGDAAFHSRRARRQAVASVASHLGETLDASRRQAAAGRLRRILDPPGAQLCRAYLTAKLLYIGITVAQFFIINAYLSAGSRTVPYGLSLAVNLTLGRPWEESGYFPRVTYCDFLIRVLGNEQRHTVQCVLQINRLNEKVYALLWFWMAGLACLTGRSLLTWCWRLVRPAIRRRYLTRLLRMRGSCSGGGGGGGASLRCVAEFADRVGPDGILLLALVDSNAGPAAAAEICEELWRRSQRGDGSFLTPAAADSTAASASSASVCDGSASVVKWESDDQV